MPLDIVVQTKAEYEQGTAVVSRADPSQGCPQEYIGTSSTAQAKGCGHKVCTKAKGQATGDLVNILTGTNGAGCVQFISSFTKCKKGPGCKKRGGRSIRYYNLEALKGENALATHHFV